jgi:hypothetical protein
VWLTVLALQALRLHAVCHPEGQDSGRENLGISNDEYTSLDSGREQGGERTAFCAVPLACRASVVPACSPDGSQYDTDCRRSRRTEVC